MQIISHRGLVSKGIIENTLEAFDKALEVGATSIECDVRLCGTGEVVLMHDPTLWRTDGRFLPVGITSLYELQRRCSYHIPTLEEFLERYSGKCQIILDLKGTRLRSTELERKIVKLLDKCKPGVVVSCTDAISLCKIASIDSSVELALITGDRFKLSRFSPVMFAFNAIHISEKLAGKSHISFWKRRGMKVRVWTVNTSRAAERLAGFGVDGIFTDNESLISTLKG